MSSCVMRVSEDNVSQHGREQVYTTLQNTAVKGRGRNIGLADILLSEARETQAGKDEADATVTIASTSALFYVMEAWE